MTLKTDFLMTTKSDESSGVRVPLLLSLILAVTKHVNSLIRRSDGTIHRRFADFIEQKVSVDRAPDRGGIASRDVVLDSRTGVWARLFYPTRPAPAPDMSSGLPVIFYFHGGGFVVLCANHVLYDRFCRRLARYCNALVVSVNYRRAPEHRYPTAYEDCMLALRWLWDGGADELAFPFKLNLSCCFLSGDSAGGNITHHVGYEVASNPSHMAPLRIQGHILLFPYFGGEERTGSELRLHSASLVTMENSDWHWKAFLPKGADRDHPASNVFGPNAPGISHLDVPASLIAVGEFDSLKDWQFRYAEGLRKAGKHAEVIYYEGGAHSFHLFSQFKLSTRLLLDVHKFVASLSEPPL